MKTIFPSRGAALALSIVISGLFAPVSHAAVTPGGTFTDKAILTEAGGGELLARATAAGGFGPALTHDFDTVVALDGSYEALSGSQIALSSGRHLVMYSTRFDGGGTNRAEILTNLNLGGVPLAAGYSQGFFRMLGNANEAIISGGAIINVAADDTVLTLQSLRSDINSTNTATRAGNGTSAQLLKLNDSWDYLSLQRSVDQGSVINDVAFIDVTYDTNNSPGTMGTAFSFAATSGDVTLNEAGLYLVFANTGVMTTGATPSPTGTRTMFQQRLTLDGTEVLGSKTTTYVRGDGNAEDARNGVASIGLIVSATAGQVLNVDFRRETGGIDGMILGGQTALTIVKLPPTAKYIEVTDTTNQQILNSPAAGVVNFNMQTTAVNSDFTHSGGSTITVNAAQDYLFLGSIFTESDATNDNNDRSLVLHGWQIDGTGGAINRGLGSSYNRDTTGNRTSGSWASTLLSLTGGQTVQMTSENLGTLPAGTDPILPNIPLVQGLSIGSLIVSNDPAISVNLPIEIIPNGTGTITSAFLDTFDADTAPTGLTYTVDTLPAGGTLRKNGTALGIGGTFTQDDIDNNRIVFDAGGVEVAGGFDFTVSDGSASDSSTFVVNVAWPTVALTIVAAGDAVEGDTGEWTIFSDIAPVGADITVDIAYSGTATGGSDFTAVATATVPAGSTTGSLEVPFATDGLFEGAESVIATITGGSGATTNPTPGVPASARLHILDSGNRAPTGSNLSQVLIGTGTLPLGTVTVIDPDATYSSAVITGGTPFSRTNGITDTTVFGDSRPDDDTSFDADAGFPGLSQAAGFSVEIAYIPQADDLTGVVDIWEIGGSSNGSCVCLIDGIPHISVKAGGTAANEPTDSGDPGFVDTDWATDNQVVVPLAAAPLRVGEEAQIAVVFDITGSVVKSSVNGSAEVTTSLFNQDNTNFLGDHTFNVGRGAGTGTGSSNSGTGVLGTASPAVIKNPAGGPASVSSLVFWNESGGSAQGTAGVADSVTATLTIQGWSATAGDLTAASGNGETYASGVWSVTGTSSVVNAALAAAAFVTNVGTADPTVILISLDDGNEDGGGPTLGSIVVSANAPDPIYVDDGFPSVPGGMIADADGGPAVAPAIFGFNAFNDLATALGNSTPSGTVIVNDGDYTSESITLADMITLQLTDTAGPVRIGDVGTGLTNSIVLSGSNTLELGAANGASVVIASGISGSGNLSKVGTGRVILRTANPYTGTTTVTDGAFRIGYDSGNFLNGELTGDGPVEVNAPGVLEFAPQVDTIVGQTGVISGTGQVKSLDDGTLVFDGPAANTFSGGFELGDGTTSSFDGTSGAKQGFVVVNHNGHLGTGLVLSRGSQLQAGMPGLVIPNNVDITGGGFRCGGSNDFTLTGDLNPIDNANRGFGNYGLEGLDILATGNVNTDGGAMIPEGVEGKDNGSWTFTGNITGSGNVTVQASFDDGEVTFSGTNTYAGFTEFRAGTTFYNAAHTGGGAYTVFTTATLAGSGSTDSAVTVNTGATLSPGTNGTGIFTCGGLNVGGTLAAEFNGNTPGTGHDQMVVNGTVSITGNLIGIPGPGLTPGTLPFIINDDGGDVVTGNFAGLPEGTILDAADLGLNGSITYLAGGGDSNDTAFVFSSYTTIGQWRVDNYGTPANSGAGENTAVGPNGRTNLENFALGFDANGSGDSGTLILSGGSITQLGGPQIWEDPMTGRFYFQYTRRTDYASAGLTITEEFSRDLTLFEVDPASMATVVATGTGDDGVPIQALQVELPGTLPISGGKARFAQLVISIAP